MLSVRVVMKSRISFFSQISNTLFIIPVSYPLVLQLVSLLVVVNNAAMNVGMQTSFPDGDLLSFGRIPGRGDLLSFGRIPGTGAAGSDGASGFNFWRSLHFGSHRAAPVCAPTSSAQGLLSSSSLQLLPSLVSFGDSRSVRCE